MCHKSGLVFTVLRKKKPASSGILRKSLIASRSFESSQIWVFSPWVLLLNADAAAAVNGARKLRTTAKNRNRRQYWVYFVTNWRTRDLQICHFFLKVLQLWAGQGHQNSYLAKLKNCHNISLLPSCHTIEVLNSTVNVITFKIKSGLFGTWFRHVDLLDLPTP